MPRQVLNVLLTDLNELVVASELPVKVVRVPGGTQLQDIDFQYTVVSDDFWQTRAVLEDNWQSALTAAMYLTVESLIRIKQFTEETDAM
jgi:hypothetical protein